MRDTGARMVTTVFLSSFSRREGESMGRWGGVGWAQVSTKVDEVRVMMEGNINRLIDNAEALNQVEDKAGAASSLSRAPPARRSGSLHPRRRALACIPADRSGGGG